MKRILTGLAAILVLGVIAAAAAVLSGRLSVPFLPHPVRPHVRPAPQPVEVTVPTITTNLADAGGAHFAEVALTISLRDAAVAKTFSSRLAAVQDAVIADLRQRSSAQLAGAGGMQGLGNAITVSVDQVLRSQTAVRHVYFTEFVVQ